MKFLYVCQVFLLLAQKTLSTDSPTSSPTLTIPPTVSSPPSYSPSISVRPTSTPTIHPTTSNQPSLSPTIIPTPIPTITITQTPSISNQPTSVPSLLPVSRCSVSSCSGLGWGGELRNTPSSKDSIGICCSSNTEPLSANCSGFMDFRTAREYCESVGARLCTRSELRNDECYKTGCNYDVAQVWTTTRCGDNGTQYITTWGASQCDSCSGTVCANENVADTYVARCCADRFTCAPTSVPSISSFPSLLPTPEPTQTPIPLPTPPPTLVPVFRPTPVPTSPSFSPTFKPSPFPTEYPTYTPSAHPSFPPTYWPSYYPTPLPTLLPTPSPTLTPSLLPTDLPTLVPSPNPTLQPSLAPTTSPSLPPSSVPTSMPTLSPTMVPTSKPSTLPTLHPTPLPTLTPSFSPTILPTPVPSLHPTQVPILRPTPLPSLIPTSSPSLLPTLSLVPSSSPSSIPTVTPLPSAIPTPTPTTWIPSSLPTAEPSTMPTYLPSIHPSPSPTVLPISNPTSHPTPLPSELPTSSPTFPPTFSPTDHPTIIPSPAPTLLPSIAPSAILTESPTILGYVTLTLRFELNARAPPTDSEVSLLELLTEKKVADLINFEVSSQQSSSSSIRSRNLLSAVVWFASFDVTSTLNNATRKSSTMVSEISSASFQSDVYVNLNVTVDTSSVIAVTNYRPSATPSQQPVIPPTSPPTFEMTLSPSFSPTTPRKPNSGSSNASASVVIISVSVVAVFLFTMFGVVFYKRKEIKDYTEHFDFKSRLSGTATVNEVEMMIREGRDAAEAMNKDEDDWIDMTVLEEIRLQMAVHDDDDDDDDDEEEFRRFNKKNSNSEEVKVDDGDDEMKADDGDDEMKVDDGDDEVKADDGDDEVKVDDGDDEMKVDDGDDEVKVDDGDDEMKVDDGDDEVKVDDGDDEVKVDDDSRSKDGLAKMDKNASNHIVDTQAEKHADDIELDDTSSPAVSETVEEEERKPEDDGALLTPRPSDSIGSISRSSSSEMNETIPRVEKLLEQEVVNIAAMEETTDRAAEEFQEKNATEEIDESIEAIEPVSMETSSLKIDNLAVDSEGGGGGEVNDDWIEMTEDTEDVWNLLKEEDHSALGTFTPFAIERPPSPPVSFNKRDNSETSRSDSIEEFDV